MSSADEAIIEFDIILDAKLSEDTQSQIKELKELREQEKTESSKESVQSTLDVLEDKKIKSELVDALNELDDTEIKQLGSMAKNPQAFTSNLVEKILPRIFGSGATAILGPLSLAIASPIVMIEFIKAMSVKGGPLNRDWRRFIQSEVEVGLSRVQQKEKDLGISQTILTQIVGFKPNNENWTYNSLYDVNDSRIARIGLSDREAGTSLFLR